MSAIKDRGEYPLPRHAAYIWQADDQIYLGLPPRFGEQFGHTVRFPATVKGIALVLDTLRERARLPESLIGSKAEPTQYQLDHILDQMRKQKFEERQQKIEQIDKELAELGL
jgi:hypothetical protein